MTDQRTFLKIKLKSLAAEARIIKREERRAKKNRDLADALTYHRRFVVRPEARVTLLAYGFFRGRRYQDVEHSTRPLDWGKVRAMVKKYSAPVGRPQKLQDLEAWITEADAYRAALNTAAPE